MSKLGSLIVIMLLAVFAASSIVHAVSANAMSLDMAMSEDGTMSMTDCQDCPEDGNGDPDGAACKLVCTTPPIASLNATGSFVHAVPVLRHKRPIGMTIPHGLRAPPEPFPPRTFI